MKTQANFQSSDEEAGIRFNGSTRTRQEFGADADVNIFLKRYGVTPGVPFQGGEVDYDLTLQDAHLLVRSSKEAFRRLPGEVRKQFPTWEALFDAATAGRVAVKDGVPFLVEGQGEGGEAKASQNGSQMAGAV